MRKRALTAARRALAVVALAALGVAVSAAVAQEPGSTQTTTEPGATQTTTEPGSTQTSTAPGATQTTTAPTPSGEQDDGLIEIHPADESEPIVLSLDDVEGTIDTSSYRVRDADGNERLIEVTPENGAAINDFLHAVELDGSEDHPGYKYVDIAGVAISRTRIRDFQQPAVYIDPDGATYFLRPVARRNDILAMVPVASRPLVVEQSTDALVRVKVEASSAKVAAGEPVTFTARVRGGGVGDRYDVKWSFGDGERAAGRARVRHRFEEAGRYRVEVTVENPDDFGRGAAPVWVGKPRDDDENREGGGTNEDAGAPTSGSYDGDSGSGEPYSNFDYSTGDQPTGDGYDYEPYDPAPAPDPAPPPSGPRVAGNLLTDISAPPSSSAVERAVRTGTFEPEEPVDPVGVPTAAWALGGAVALLGMGAGMESGRPRRLRPLRRGPGAATPGATGGRPLLRRLLRR